MTETKPDCSARVHHTQVWGTSPYSRKGKVKRGEKWYCTIHDPVRVEKKRAEREAKWDKEWAKKQAVWDRDELEKHFCAGVSNEYLDNHTLIKLIGRDK